MKNKKKKNPSGRRKMIPVGNLDLHKGIKGTRNGSYMS